MILALSCAPNNTQKATKNSPPPRLHCVNHKQSACLLLRLGFNLERYPHTYLDTFFVSIWKIQ